MGKQIVPAIVAAVLASLVTAYLVRTPPAALTPGELDQLATTLAAHPALQGGTTSSFALTVTPKHDEEAWLQGMGADGRPRPGPADDVKPMTKADNSVCFLTDVEFSGFNSNDDTLACRVTVDEFTGFWELHAIQGDNTDGSVRCNASCLSWQ